MSTVSIVCPTASVEAQQLAERSKDPRDPGPMPAFLDRTKSSPGLARLKKNADVGALAADTVKLQKQARAEVAAGTGPWPALPKYLKFLDKLYAKLPTSPAVNSIEALSRRFNIKLDRAILVFNIWKTKPSADGVPVRSEADVDREARKGTPKTSAAPIADKLPTVTKVPTGARALTKSGKLRKATTPAAKLAKPAIKTSSSKYDWDEADVAARSGKVPALPPFASYAPHMKDVFGMAKKGDAKAITEYAKGFKDKAGGRANLFRYIDLCLLSLSKRGK